MSVLDAFSLDYSPISLYFTYGHVSFQQIMLSIKKLYTEILLGAGFKYIFILILALSSVQNVWAVHRSSSKNNWILNKVISQIHDGPNGGTALPHMPGSKPGGMERVAGSDSAFLAWSSLYS
jgi:hypothetical protein